MKKLAIIGSGRMAWIFGRNAKEMGIESHAFSFDDNCIAKESVSEHHLVNILEKDKILEMCRSIGINGVVATTELTVPVAAYVAEKMGLNGMPFEVAQVVTDKYRNRIACKNVIELSQPGFAEVQTLNEIKSLNFSYPIILKPTSKGGKKGISVVRNEDELSAAFELAKANSGSCPIIVEEYISDGQEYSVESLSFHGTHTVVQVTEKISSGPPHCVELGHHQPANLSREMRQKLEVAIEKGLAAIGVDNSTCHTEIKIVKDKIYLIEFNARPGGDHIAWPLTELSTGYPYIKGAIDIALNQLKPVEKSSLLKRYAGVYFVTTQSAYLKPLYDKCEEYTWLYKKNIVSSELQPLEHNDCYGTNSMMYYSEIGRPDINILQGKDEEEIENDIICVEGGV